MMENDKYIKIGYRYIDGDMVRVVTFPTGFSIAMFDDETYSVKALKGGEIKVNFGQNSRILKDEYGRYWYYKVTKVGDMESFETFELLPEYIVSEEYEEKRIPGMMLFPYIRVDHARAVTEVFERRYVVCRDEEDFKKKFLERNEKNIEKMRGA